MCTALFHLDESGLAVTMNRDERHERGAEIAPVMNITGLRWIGPRDSDQGGSWIGVNELGLLCFLLNAYLPGENKLHRSKNNHPSRGGLVTRALQHDFDGARAGLEQMADMAPYLPFTMVLAKVGRACSYDWDGDQLTVTKLLEGWQLFTSSSWQSQQVCEKRQRLFDRWLAEGKPQDGSLPTLNLLSLPGDEAASPMMKRWDAATRSITQVQVERTRQRALLKWWRCDHRAVTPDQPDAIVDLMLKMPTEVR